MASPIGAIIAGAALAALAAIVYFRKELFETAQYAGQGFAALGAGVQSGISSFVSPQITPKLEPTIGLNLTGILGTLFGQGGTTPKQSTRSTDRPADAITPKIQEVSVPINLSPLPRIQEVSVPINLSPLPSIPAEFIPAEFGTDNWDQRYY